MYRLFLIASVSRGETTRLTAEPLAHSRWDALFVLFVFGHGTCSVLVLVGVWYDLVLALCRQVGRNNYNDFWENLWKKHVQ